MESKVNLLVITLIIKIKPFKEFLHFIYLPKEFSKYNFAYEIANQECIWYCKFQEIIKHKACDYTIDCDHWASLLLSCLNHPFSIKQQQLSRG